MAVALRLSATALTLGRARGMTMTLRTRGLWGVAVLLTGLAAAVTTAALAVAAVPLLLVVLEAARVDITRAGGQPGSRG